MTGRPKVPFKLKCNLAEHMLKCCISQEEMSVCLADRGVRLSQAEISDYCVGRSMPNIAVAYAVADYIGVTVEEIWPPYEWAGWNKGWELKK